MHIALVCSNYLPLKPETTKGTEIFVLSYLQEFVKQADQSAYQLTVFASGNSQVPVPLVSIAPGSSSEDQEIIRKGKHVPFELALISKALQMQDQFDLFHFHIGDGDIVLPFLPFIQKPVLITLHHVNDADFTRQYFSLFSHLSHVHFVSISDAQRKLLPDLSYAATIHHGVDTELYGFDHTGGQTIMWAGRLVKDKGIDTVVHIIKALSHKAALFSLPRKEEEEWFKEVVEGDLEALKQDGRMRQEYNWERFRLIPEFQQSKLFFFPVRYEESFGLVLIESMACGTPVVAFARGSIPEIVIDGVTGFLVNPSDDDIRGDFVIKETGEEGLKKAIERVYSMNEDEYKQMREQCRKHVENNFSSKKMVQSYLDIYSTLVKNA